MNLLLNILGTLAFRPQALRNLASRRALLPGALLFCAGFLAFKLTGNRIYAAFQDQTPVFASTGLLDTLLRLNLVQVLLFLYVVYLPTIACLSNAIAGEGLGLTMSRAEYEAHAAVLMPLWGTILLITAPIPLLLPQVILADLGMVSMRFLLFSLLTVIYTLWSIREVNYLSTAAAAGVFILSIATLPVFYVLIEFFFSLPLFIMLAVFYLSFQRLRVRFSSSSEERRFKDRLQHLTLNPQDADAHYQLGLIQMRRGNLDSAQIYLERAAKIDPQTADYHYWLGRVFECKEEWSAAMEQYEETYRLNPQQGVGDIIREVGKAYLQTGNETKAIEFLNFFLERRGSDPEGRYWLAVALQKQGKYQDMRVQLNTILEQARSNPRFFRRENRQWILRSRRLLKRGIP